MSRSALGYIHTRLESERDVVQVFSKNGIALEMFVVRFGVELVDLLIESFAFVVYLLQLFISGLRLVSRFIDGLYFPLDSCEVLSHVEDSEVVSNESQPLLILLVLLINRIVSKHLKTVVLNVKDIIRRLINSTFNGLVKVLNEIGE